MYTDRVMEHFMCPQNAHSMVDADGVGEYGGSSCGDTLTIYIKVKDEVITDISYLIFGCTASIATSSITSVLVKGKTIAEALTLKNQDIEDALGGLPPSKRHCSNLGVQALRAAIENYRERQASSQQG